MNWSRCCAAAMNEDISFIMKIEACKKGVVSICQSKCFAFLLFLAVFVIIFVVYYTDILEESGQRRTESEGEETSTGKFHMEITTTNPNVTTDSNTHQDFCTLKPLSPEDALEERLLLDSIAWPDTPLLPSPFSLEQTSDPAHSTFTILPENGGQWHVGDQLKVMIKMYDFKGHPKKFGGDVLLAKLHEPTLGAGVAGQVVDHLNGSYSAVFSLLWEGRAQVQVMLVHPSEAVTVLRRLNSEQPDRVYFKSDFHSGLHSEVSICNVCLRPTNQSVCNFTDLHTGDPWFCYKPKKLNCDARISHFLGDSKQNLRAGEEKLFQGRVNMKVPIHALGPANVTVLPKETGKAQVNSTNEKSELSGYYYQGVWRALGGTRVQQFNTSSAISLCLKGKKVHLFGDSTVRQWFEYLDRTLPDLKKFDLHSSMQAGPFMAMDYTNNILVTFRIHGPPLRAFKFSTTELRFIANELDRIPGGTNTVVVFGIWAHFGSFPVEVYIRRLQGIRRAVVRLLNRAPGTVVVIRTANPKGLTLKGTILNSDWYSLQNDKVLRAMFKGLNVHFLYAWEMVLAHHLPHNLHPQPPIIKNMINVILSYICPLKGG